MLKPDYSAYEGAAPYFKLVRGALGDLVNGEHFFDVVADDVVYEVLYDFPGWPRIVRGRPNLMALFGGYVQAIALESADHLILHKAEGGRVVVIEYEVHGTSSPPARTTPIASVRSSRLKSGRSRIGATIWICWRPGTP